MSGAETAGEAPGKRAALQLENAPRSPWKNETSDDVRPVVFGEVARRFKELYGEQTAGGNQWLEFVPERDHKVFGRGNDAAEEVHFVVEIAVIALVHDRGVEDILEVAEIHDAAGVGIRLATEGDFQNVVVSVPMR